MNQHAIQIGAMGFFLQVATKITITESDMNILVVLHATRIY